MLIGAAWLLLLWRESSALRLAKILLAAGAGHIGFAIMRLAFFAFYQGNLVWFAFWEVFTELMLVVGVLVVMQLFRPRPSEGRSVNQGTTNAQRHEDPERGYLST